MNTFRFVVGAIAAGIPVSASAYPISPVTLWGLVSGSQVVVLARVDRVERVEASPSEDRFESVSRGNDIAYLRVVETWKGPEQAVIGVPFRSTLLCPAPPYFAAGETVLAFLEVGERGFSVRGLSYGTLYPSPSEVPIYRTLIADAKALQARDEIDEAARHRWLVQAASHRATRWSGLYELVPEYDKMHSYYDDHSDSRPRSMHRLTKKEAAAIARGFVEGPSVDATLPMILAVLEGHRDPAFDRAVLGAVSNAMQDAEAYWAEDALRLALARLDLPFGAPLPEKWEDADARRTEMKRRWSEALEKRGIKVEPMKLDEDGRWLPVGGRTPS